MNGPARFPAFTILSVAFLAAGLCACGGPKAKPKDPASESGHNIRLAESYFTAGKINRSAWNPGEGGGVAAGETRRSGTTTGSSASSPGATPRPRQSFTEALELDPHLTDARNNLGAVYDATGRKDLAEKAVSEGPRGPDLLVSRRRPTSTSDSSTRPRGARRRRSASFAKRSRSTRSSGADTTSSRRARQGGAARRSRARVRGRRPGLQGERRIPVPYRARLHEARPAERRRVSTSPACQELSPGSESASRAYDLLKLLP